MAGHHISAGLDDGINEELEAYNPMVPDGSNFKATFMIEYTDPLVRAAQLEKWSASRTWCGCR
jgi:hypothetical protein